MAQTANIIDITKVYKNLKSPAIPSCLKAIGDELMVRVKSGQFRVLPPCWSSLVMHAAELRKHNASELQDLLDGMDPEKRRLSGLTDDRRNIADCSMYSTQKIFAAFWEFLVRCQQSLNIQLSYPSLAWVILGPPYTNHFDQVDEVHFTKNVNALLDSVLEQSLVKRDMLCYVMKILSELIQVATEYCRDKPHLVSITRYHIASHFGPILFTIHCERCKTIMIDTNRSCDYCITVGSLMQKPFVVDFMDRLLRYFTEEFWTNAVQIAHRSSVPVQSDAEHIHADVMNMFYKQKPATNRSKQKAALPPPALAKARASHVQQPQTMTVSSMQSVVPRETSIHKASIISRTSAPNMVESVTAQTTNDVTLISKQPTTMTTTLSTEWSSLENVWDLSAAKKSVRRKSKKGGNRRSSVSSKSGGRTSKRSPRRLSATPKQHRHTARVSTSRKASHVRRKVNSRYR